MRPIAFFPHLRPRRAVHQPPLASPEHDQSGQNTDAGGGKGGCAEIGHRDRVLDRRCARQCRHGKCERPQRNRGGDQPFGDVGLAKQRGGDRIDRKSHDKQRHTAIGQNRAGQHHGQDRLSAPKPHHQAGSDGLCCAAVVHQPAKDRAQQEQRKERDDKAACRSHEDLSVKPQQGCGGKAGGDHRQQRRQEQY